METRMLLTKQFVKKTAVKIVAFIIMMVIITAFLQSITPVITNDIALGQLENSDEMFVMWETYNKLKPLVNLAYSVTVILFVVAIGRDTAKFIKAIRSDNT